MCPEGSSLEISWREICLNLLLGDQRGPEGTSTTGPVLLNLEYYKVVAAQLGSRGFQQVMLGGISPFLSKALEEN